MSTTIVQERPWDLTHLVRFLPGPSGEPAPTHQDHLHHDRQHDPQPEEYGGREPRVLNHDRYVGDDLAPCSTNSTSTTTGLGDFAKVWQFLGAPATIAHVGSLDAIPSKEDYASDGATYQIRPREHLSEEGTDGDEDNFAPGRTYSIISSEAVRKQQKRARKKANKKKREAALAAVGNNRTALSESECDNSHKDTPARKASSHFMATRSMGARLTNEQAVADAALFHLDDGAPETPCPKPIHAKPLSHSQNPVNANGETSLPTKPLENSERARELPRTYINPNPPRTLTNPYVAGTYTTPNVYKTNNLIPSSVQPLRNGKVTSPQGVVPVQNMAAPMSAKKPVTPPTHEPLILRSGEDRNLALFLKIMNNFQEDRKHMVKPMAMTSHNKHPSGIHVFIDVSNIFIGFANQMKLSRNTHSLQSVPDFNLSFASLALLIERQRPIAKRVLVGSTPHLPAFDQAKAVGYECSILEKVYKARELTERQVYFQERDRGYAKKSSTKVPPPAHKVALAGSVLTPGGRGSETNTTPQFAPPKFVEQGVDEILHLKMLESLVDTEVPSTIVLATGDAACAEYSSGFQAMVERALRKGWKVELTSWSKNISTTYRHPAWIAAYGEQFRIIELDDYAEELLDM